MAVNIRDGWTQVQMDFFLCVWKIINHCDSCNDENKQFGCLIQIKEWREKTQSYLLLKKHNKLVLVLHENLISAVFYLLCPLIVSYVNIIFY